MNLLICLLLLIQSSAFSQQWNPHISTLNGKIRVIVSILKEHPDFFKQNVKYKTNPLMTLRPVPYLHSHLGKYAADLDFGKTLRMYTEYTDEGELIYDKDKIELLKNDIIGSLESVFSDLQSIELNQLGSDLIRISNSGEQTLKDFFKLLPFIYDSNGIPLFEKFDSNSKSIMLDKISSATAGELDNNYHDLLKEHSNKYIDDIGNNRVSSAFNSFKKEFINGKKNYVLKNALIPLSSTGRMLEKRSASIEEVPALVGLFRGNFGKTCATRDIPYYPLIKGTKTYLIRKSINFSDPDDGFAFVAPVNLNGEILPYIITINGPGLTNIDAAEVIRMIGKAWNTKKVILPNLELNPHLINTENVKQGMRFNDSTNLEGVEMPNGWKTIDEYFTKSKPKGFLYYSASFLKNAKLLVLDRESSSKSIYGTTYKRPSNIKSFNVTERSILAFYCVDDYTSEEDEILSQFEITKKQLNAAAVIVNASPLNPINAQQFELINTGLGFEFSDLADFDIMTRTNSLIELYKESPDLTTGKGWSGAFTAVNKKLTPLMHDAKDQQEMKMIINAKISTPEKYWIDEFVEGIMTHYDSELILNIIELISIKSKTWPIRLWEVIPTLLNSKDEKLRAETINVLSTINDLSADMWNILIERLYSRNDERINEALSVIKNQKKLPTGAWEAISDIILNGSASAKAKASTTVGNIKEWHRDFWEQIPNILTTYEGVCILANRGTWPDYFWATVPSLMKSENDRIRWGILTALTEKKSWPTKVLDEARNMLKDEDSDVSKAVKVALQNKEDTGPRQRLSAYVGKEFSKDEELAQAVLEKFIEDIKGNNGQNLLRGLAVMARKENLDFMKKASASFPELYEPIKSLVDGFSAGLVDWEDPYSNNTKRLESRDRFIKMTETLRLK